MTKLNVNLISCFIVALVVATLYLEDVESVVPISGYEQVTLFNGKLTKRNTVLVTCTERDAIGQLLVGNYNVNVTCVPPSYNYRYTVVGAVPRATQLHIEKACLVKDSEQFEVASQVAKREIGGDLTNADTTSLTTPPARRLLFFDPVAYAALGVGLLALSEARNANANANRANDRLDIIDGTLKTQDTLNKQYNAGINNNTRVNQLQDEQLRILASDTQGLQSDTRSLQTAFSEFGEAAKEEMRKTQAQFDAVKGVIQQNNAALEANAEASFQFTKEQFRAVQAQMTQMNTILQTEIDSLIHGQLETTQNLQNTVISINQLVLQAQLHRLVTQSFFASNDELDERLKPFTLGVGIRPALQLLGPDKRVLLDRFDYNWVTNTTGNRYSVYASQVRFYVDSLWGIDNLRYATTVTSLPILFGEQQCNRAYGDPDTPVDNFNVTCKMWAEVRTSVCIGTEIGPKFGWGSANSTQLRQAYCNGAITTLQPVVLRTFTDLLNHYAGDMCTTPEPIVSLISLRGHEVVAIPRTPQCSLPWKLQTYSVGTTADKLSMLYTSLIVLSNSFKSVALDLYDRELQVFGRNPGGFKYEKRDNDYVPTRYNGTKPIFDGGAAPVDCSYASWLAVHRQAVNMYSVSPMASPTVRKQVIVGVAGPECSDPLVCYPVGDRDVNANIQLNNDASATLPGNFLMLGELKDLRDGIYDVPTRSLSASSATSERANTPSYILMPPDTRDTTDLADWIAANTDLFDPTLGAVSPELYRYDTSYDSENYPTCTLKNEPLLRFANLTTNGCIRPWQFNTSIASATTTISSNSLYPTECSSLQSTTLYKDYKTELATPSQNVNPNSVIAANVAGSGSYSFSFWYRQDSVLGDNGAVSVFTVFSSSLSAFVRYGVSANGVPFVNHGNSVSSAANSITLKDGLWHFVAWSVTASSGTFHYSLFVDRTSFGVFDVAATGFTGQSPFVSQVNNVLPQSKSAEVANVQFFADTAVSASSLASLHACGLAALPVSRCYTNGTEVVFARQSVTQTGGVSCLPNSVLLASDYYHDKKFPLAVDLRNAMQGEFSLAFLLRGGNKTVTNYKLLEVAANGARVTVQYVTSNIVQVTVNGQSSALQLYNGQTSFLGLTYDGSAATLTVNGDLSTSFNATRTEPLITTPLLQVNSDAVFNVKYYDFLLTNAQFNIEGNCQLEPTLNATSAVSTVGACWVPTNQTVGYGYCRQTTGCAGHCFAYSLVDRTSGVYSAVANGCDAGYSQSACTKKCSRIDSISGQCLTEATTKAIGLTPGSPLCSTLSNYKLAVNPSSGLLTFTPRVWQYTVSIGIPNGVVTNVVNSGTCPSVEIIPAIDGSYNVLLKNDNTESSVVSVLYAPEAVFTQGADCVSPCCQLASDITYSIPGKSSLTVNIASAGCGNQTILVQQATNVFDPFADVNGTAVALGSCSRIDASQLSLIVSTAFNQPVPTNVASRLTQTLDTAAYAIKNVGNAIAQQLVDIIALGSTVGFQSAVFQDVLLAQRTAIETSTYNPLNLTSTLPEFDLSKLIEAISNSSSTLNSKFNTTSQLYAANRLKFDALSEESRAIIDGSIAAQNETARLIKLISDTVYLDRGNFDDNPFGKLVEDIAIVAGETALKAAHAGATIIDSGLDVLGVGGGLLGGLGGIGSLIGDIVKFAIYGAIIYGVYVVGSFLYARASAASAARKAYTKVPEFTDIAPKQTGTAGRADPTWIQRQNRANKVRYSVEHDY